MGQDRAKDKGASDRILDEAHAAVRSVIAKLKVERKNLVSRIDEQIKKLSATLPVGETLSLLASAEESTTAPAGDRTQVPIDGARPRGERQVKIYEYILTHPTAGYREIVEAVYGEYNEPHYNSTRNAIAALKKNGWVTGERGEWTLQEGKNT